MEGLKLIAQSTFDRHQKFRPGPSPGTSSSEGSGPYRYNVIEIGTFNTSGSSGTLSKRQSVASLASAQNGSAGVGSRATLNEWMVYEADLSAFMKKRPVQVVATSWGSAEQSERPKTSSTTHSASQPSSMTTGTSTATATTAPTSTTAGTGNARRANGGRDEIEAVASLKLVCVQLAADLGDDDVTSAGSDPDNTLAISRGTFLRLYVDVMDADHCALYYLAREYDGFHEWNDQNKSVTTKFVGTSDYALIWTFNRRTLETKGLFIDRYQRWQSKDSISVPTTTAQGDSSEPGSAQVTPGKGGQGDSASIHTVSSKKWTHNRSGAVTASEAWQVFRETLNTYRAYVITPQLLSFVSCVHMLRSFDDQVNGDDLPRLKDAEDSIALAQVAVQSDAREPNRLGGSIIPTQMSSYASVPEHDNPFDPSTPPNELEKALPAVPKSPSPHLDRQKLMSQTLTTSKVDTSLSNKLRHLKTARTIFEAIAQEHETVMVDVVAPEFLDRYHRAMQSITEAIPALERHVASLEEYLRYLKGRSERLSGTAGALVRCLTLLTLSSPGHGGSSASRNGTQSDDANISLRVNEADSRSDLGAARPVTRPNGWGAARGVSPAATLRSTATSGRPCAGGEGLAKRGERGEVDGRGRNLNFYAGYLFRGNYSHRLT